MLYKLLNAFFLRAFPLKKFFKALDFLTANDFTDCGKDDNILYWE